MVFFKKSASHYESKNRLLSMILALVMILSIGVLAGCSKEEKAADTGYKAVVEAYVQSLQNRNPDEYIAITEYSMLSEEDLALAEDEIAQVKSDCVATYDYWSEEFGEDYTASVEIVEEKFFTDKQINYLKSTYNKQKHTELTNAVTVTANVTFGDDASTAILEMVLYKVEGNWYLQSVQRIEEEVDSAAESAAE
ncbi:MAG: hypothetical protein II998_02965 [Clostridia bacterium]|nr:hypothetical protein [Clostridia bacterium]